MDKITAMLPSGGELIVNCAYTAFLQPVNVVKVLIQVNSLIFKRVPFRI